MGYNRYTINTDDHRLEVIGDLSQMSTNRRELWE